MELERTFNTLLYPVAYIKKAAEDFSSVANFSFVAIDENQVRVFCSNNSIQESFIMMDEFSNYLLQMTATAGGS